MVEQLRHRGPDDAGIESGDGWELGFRRLSILDLSPSGHQPMRSGDGRYWLAFNGEIYNYLELRQDLERAGERFRSGSDTEVLLRLLMRSGADALPLLNGMFALAFVDTKARSFVLARDRLGVKPLYYAVADGCLRFASELKALVAEPNVDQCVDSNAVAQYLALGYLPGETCIFEGHSKLPPGHVLSGTLDRPEAAYPKPYWSLELNDDPGQRAITPAELNELESLLLDAVRIRLRSDVPVGLFLSGGLDSGLVAAMAAKSEVAPLALTIGFAEEGWDESKLASLTANHVGLQHRIVPQRSGGLADVDRLAWFFDEPFGDPSALPFFTLCEAAAGHATVFLSGDGGDEMFAGYRRYIETLNRAGVIKAAGRMGGTLRMASRLLPQGSLARYRLSKLALPDDGCAAAFDESPDDPVLSGIVHPDLRSSMRVAGGPIWERWQRSRGAGVTTRQQRLDYGLYLPDDVLVKVDRASMAHSIEVRSPFMDVRLVEWVARLPRSTLLNRTHGKLPLRALGPRLLPEATLQAQKRGFGAPLDDWFRSAAGRAMVQDRLLACESQASRYWNVAAVERLLRVHGSGRGRGFGVILWRLLMLDAWSRHYADARHERWQASSTLSDSRVTERDQRPAYNA
jgi:asparagine synthase (glutamine-hydrolysing)